ncbi:hypothetical protein [Paenibacillus polymyxa]|uniref:Uncharacterized protein n=1 Tax=Paenibacillus polymyxa (strain SC2) TaxID=886882 RepID=E3EL83_PAEPS|nr:hypothetical protein [Paenibacillus polymyxa]ADO59915.2 hypothetical protein PPSC2_28590 [Paenibacillus polymyxa SC2]WPQ59861.1 hypothetical protein SKN87_26605 [Paenibacillus polymyxa]
MGRLCVGMFGMFGTCGTQLQSPWRAAFKKVYGERGVEFFDPQKEDWKPEDADLEAEHLAEDQIILFPITAATYGLGSLSEVGFSILQAIKLDDRRDFIVLIDKHLDDSLNDEQLVKESQRSRALVRKHLEKLRLDNIYVVETLDEMLEMSIELYELAERKSRFAKFNPHNLHVLRT